MNLGSTIKELQVADRILLAMETVPVAKLESIADGFEIMLRDPAIGVTNGERERIERDLAFLYKWIGRGGGAPRVGMGVTVSLYSDRQAWVIISLTAKTGVIQRCRVKFLGETIRTESQGGKWEIEPDTNGERKNIYRDKSGAWRTSGDRYRVSVGIADEYRDPSF